MQQRRRFCSLSLNSVQEVLDHYNDNHGINKDNSPTFERHIDAISKDTPQMFVGYCEYCNSPPFFDLRVKAEHYFRKHLKLLPASANNKLIRKVGDRFMEFSIDYTRHGKIYDFKDPDKIINDFIENVTRLVPEANGDFRLICCIVN